MPDPLLITSLVVATILIVSLGVVFFGAPYVPTHTKPLRDLLERDDLLPPGSTIVDLGSGDGKVLGMAADAGLRAVGYELNPLLVLISRIRLRRHIAAGSVHVQTVDFWRTPLPSDTTAVFVFLAKPFMLRFARYVAQQATRLDTPILVCSYGFELPGHTSIDTISGIVVYRIAPRDGGE